MTEHEIDNMQPGSELDRLVAEACGMKLDHNGLLVPQVTDCDCGGIQFASHRYSFRPSDAWNDAMLALDRIVGEDATLFPADSVQMEYNINGWFVYLSRITSWQLGDETSDWNDTPLTASCVAEASGESGPLAICRAILLATKSEGK